MTVVDWLLDSDPAIRWQVMQDLTDTSAGRGGGRARQGGHRGLGRPHPALAFEFAAHLVLVRWRKAPAALRDGTATRCPRGRPRARQSRRPSPDGSTKTQPCQIPVRQLHQAEAGGVEAGGRRGSRAPRAATRRGGRTTRGRGRRCPLARGAHPHGSSSCPRCRHTLAKACSAPSSDRVSRTLAVPPRATARWCLRPRQAELGGPPDAHPAGEERRAAPRRAPPGRRTPPSAASGCARAARAAQRAREPGRVDRGGPEGTRLLTEHTVRIEGGGPRSPEGHQAWATCLMRV